MAPQSIRVGILDLLGTFRDEWMSPERLLTEYTSRWGPVNPESLRRTITRLLDSETSVVDFRYTDGSASVNDNLELRMTSESYFSLADGDWTELEGDIAREFDVDQVA